MSLTKKSSPVDDNIANALLVEDIELKPKAILSTNINISLFEGINLKPRAIKQINANAVIASRLNLKPRAIKDANPIGKIRLADYSGRFSNGTENLTLSAASSTTLTPAIPSGWIFIQWLVERFRPTTEVHLTGFGRVFVSTASSNRYGLLINPNRDKVWIASNGVWTGSGDPLTFLNTGSGGNPTVELSTPVTDPIFITFRNTSGSAAIIELRNNTSSNIEFLDSLKLV